MAYYAWTPFPVGNNAPSLARVPADFFYVDVTIPLTNSLVEHWIPLTGLLLVQIRTPASFEGSAITMLTKNIGLDSGIPTIIGGSEYSIAAASSQVLLVEPKDAILLGPDIKIRSGTNAAPTNQAGTAASLTLIARSIESTLL